jgi:hypothetical protein
VGVRGAGAGAAGAGAGAGAVDGGETGALGAGAGDGAVDAGGCAGALGSGAGVTGAGGGAGGSSTGFDPRAFDGDDCAPASTTNAQDKNVTMIAASGIPRAGVMAILPSSDCRG